MTSDYGELLGTERKGKGKKRHVHPVSILKEEQRHRHKIFTC